MSIILKALKKIQEQEAGRPTTPPVGGALSPAKAPTSSRSPNIDETHDHTGPDSTAFSPAETDAGRQERQMVGARPPGARQAFGIGPKALLGLLVVVGIVTVGWFAGSLYGVNNSGRAPEAVTPEAPTFPKTPADAAVEKGPAPASSSPLGSTPSVSAPTPMAREENTRIADEKAGRFTRSLEPVAPPVFRAVKPTKPPTAEAAEAVIRPPAAPVMKEAEPEKKGRPEFKINAIAWQNKEPRAIVNMQSIYEGDMIEGATVVAIKRKMVVFEYEGETFRVRFGF